MRTRTAEAARLENDYLSRVRSALAGSAPAEIDEVILSIQEHIEQELSEKPAGEVTLVQMAQVLEWLGPPGAYALGPDEKPAATPPAPPGPSVPFAPPGVELRRDGAAFSPGADVSLLGRIPAVVPALRMIFWGGLIVVLDIRYDGFDLVNDIIGFVLIAWGVGRLMSLPVSQQYRRAMSFAFVMAVLSLIRSAVIQFMSPRIPEPILLLVLFTGLLGLIPTVIFCRCMRELCLKGGMQPPAKSWRVTEILFWAIYLIPLGVCYLLLAGLILAGEKSHAYSGAWTLLLLPIFFTPLVHLFVSTSRTKRFAQQVSRPPSGTLPHGPPQF